jgi:hypothetical protein
MHRSCAQPEDHMPNHNPRGNGRNVAVPEENRERWRPEDPNQSTRRSWDEDRGRDDRERYGSHWTDERDEGWRSTERYGHGQSGYAAGRYEDRDRSSRNLGYPGSFEEQGGRGGTDERWQGRGGSYYWQDRPQDRRYEHGRYESRTNYGYGEDPYSPQRESLGYSRETSRYYREPSGQYPRCHRGKGPMNYQRSDERIRESVCEMLTDDDRIDASRMEVHVMSGDVTLTGWVDDRYAKRLTEEIVENIPGVRDIQNQLRVGDKRGNQGAGSQVGMEQEGSKRHRA